MNIIFRLIIIVVALIAIRLIAIEKDENSNYCYIRNSHIECISIEVDDNLTEKEKRDYAKKLILYAKHNITERKNLKDEIQNLEKRYNDIVSEISGLGFEYLSELRSIENK